MLPSSPSGNAGHLEITTPEMRITDGGHIFGSTDGSREGCGADITIKVRRLEISEGGGITGGNMDGPGNGGTIEITASDSISISGKKGNLTSAIHSESLGSGDGGRIEIHTPELTVTDGGAISGIAASTGNGGHTDIYTGRLDITDGGYISGKTKGAGRGGDITISASNSIQLSGTKNGSVSAIDVSNEGEGNAGQLTISTPELSITDQATLKGVSSGGGNGSDMILNVGSLDIRGGGDINCSTSGRGAGGNLNIQATDSVSISGRGGGYTSGIYANSFKSATEAASPSPRHL